MAEAELIEAFKTGDAEAARALLKTGKFDPNLVDPDSGGTVLQVAALHGHADCVEAALDAGADPEIAHPDYGMTPLLWACFNAHLAVVQQLVRSGANCDAKDSTGLSGQELAKDNLKPGWENVVQWLAETTGAEAINIDKELKFSNELKQRMRKTLGDAGGDEDALSLLFTTEQTKQGGKPGGKRRTSLEDGIEDEPDERAVAAAAKQAAKEAALRSAFTPERLEHLFSIVDARLDEAGVHEKMVTKLLETTCAKCNGRMYGLEARLKERESTLNKVLRKLGSDLPEGDDAQDEAFTAALHSLRDLLRYTMVLKTATYVKGVNATIKLFGSHGVEPVKGNIKNFWRRKGQDTDYLGINGSFQTQEGFPFELQFHTDESIETKEEKAHHSYEQFRLTTGLEKLQYWEEMVRMWSMVPIPEPNQKLFELGTKAHHGVDRKGLEAGLSEEDRVTYEAKRSLETLVRPACDRVYGSNLNLAKQLTKNMKSHAKKDGGSLRGEEHIVKNAMSMTRKIVSDLLKDGWNGSDMGIERALMEAVDREKRNALRYTVVFSEKNYTRGINRLLKYLTKAGFEQTLLNNYWMSDEPYNAIRGRLHKKEAHDTHDLAVVFHTSSSLEMSEERMVRYQEAMGIVFHTATLVGSENKREEAEELMRQDHKWVTRCADMAAKKPRGVETVGKVIKAKTAEERRKEKEQREQNALQRGSMSLSSSTRRDGPQLRSLGSMSLSSSMKRDRQEQKAAVKQQEAIGAISEGVPPQSEPEPEPEPKSDDESSSGSYETDSQATSSYETDSEEDDVPLAVEDPAAVVELLQEAGMGEYLTALAEHGLDKPSTLVRQSPLRFSLSQNLTCAWPYAGQGAGGRLEGGWGQSGAREAAGQTRGVLRRRRRGSGRVCQVPRRASCRPPSTVQRAGAGGGGESRARAEGLLRVG